jgi:hypothetical protein
MSEYTETPRAVASMAGALRREAALAGYLPESNNTLEQRKRNLALLAARRSAASSKREKIARMQSGKVAAREVRVASYREAVASHSVTETGGVTLHQNLELQMRRALSEGPLSTRNAAAAVLHPRPTLTRPASARTAHHRPEAK